MIAVYFLHPDLGYSPVKKYFADIQDQVPYKKLVDIHNKIKHLISIDGRPEPPLFGPLIGHDVCKIKINKNSKIVIRILYFIFLDNIVLAHIFEKPSNYSGTKIDKELEKEYCIGDSHKIIFESNPKSYEEYP